MIKEKKEGEGEAAPAGKTDAKAGKADVKAPKAEEKKAEKKK